MEKPLAHPDALRFAAADATGADRAARLAAAARAYPPTHPVRGSGTTIARVRRDGTASKVVDMG